MDKNVKMINFIYEKCLKNKIVLSEKSMNFALKEVEKASKFQENKTCFFFLNIAMIFVSILIVLVFIFSGEFDYFHVLFVTFLASFFLIYLLFHFLSIGSLFY